MALTKSEYEACFYYAGIFRSPPRLVYRKSKDPFLMPTGQEAYRRSKCLYPVYNHRLGEKWKDVRPKICAVVDEKQVRISSIDLVRFRTVRDAVIGPVVIWVGVLPDSLTSPVRMQSNPPTPSSHSSTTRVTDVEVEYRESVFDADPLRYVTDPLITSLGLPIASAEKPSMVIAGTLGSYFKDGDDLYGRHILFDDNLDCNYRPTRVVQQPP